MSTISVRRWGVSMWCCVDGARDGRVTPQRREKKSCAILWEDARYAIPVVLLEYVVPRLQSSEETSRAV